MATRDERGPNGEIELYYWSEESASTHRGKVQKARLTAGESRDVLLTLECSESNACHSSSDRSKKVHTISVESLIELVKEHGEEYRLRPFGKKKAARDVS